MEFFGLHSALDFQSVLYLEVTVDIFYSLYPRTGSWVTGEFSSMMEKNMIRAAKNKPNTINYLNKKASLFFH